MKKKVIFMGTPSFAVPVLEALYKSFDVVAVITQPDKPVGRKKLVTPSQVKEMATSLHIDVLTPAKVADITEQIKSYQPDFIVSCAYGQIIPEAILDIPKFYALNVHASLLPKYRGADPIRRAMMAGEAKTGISIMKMEAGLDTGPVFKSVPVVIDLNDNYQSLHDELSKLGASLLIEVMHDIINHKHHLHHQDDTQTTYANKINKDDELIDFDRPTMQVYNQIRALNPIPGALYQGDISFKLFDVDFHLETHDNIPGTIMTDHKLMKIATKDGFIIVKTLQVPGKNKMYISDYLRGLK